MPRPVKSREQRVESWALFIELVQTVQKLWQSMWGFTRASFRCVEVVYNPLIYTQVVRKFWVVFTTKVIVFSYLLNYLFSTLSTGSITKTTTYI
jgi:hypothetical protein